LKAAVNVRIAGTKLRNAAVVYPIVGLQGVRLSLRIEGRRRRRECYPTRRKSGLFLFSTSREGIHFTALIFEMLTLVPKDLGHRA
jgi:hypothetical protein